MPSNSFPTCLAGHFSGSLDTTNRCRLSYRLYPRSTTLLREVLRVFIPMGRRVGVGQRSDSPFGEECLGKSSRGSVGGLQQPVWGPKERGGWRPIINLKGLNEYINTPHFKMESIASVKDILLPGDYLAKIDLKDAYLGIPMHKSQRKYLRCRWKGKSYQFKALSFGLASASTLSSETARDSNSDVHRRLPQSIQQQLEIIASCSISQTRVHHQIGRRAVCNPSRLSSFWV